jgi:hypothetical protein
LSSSDATSNAAQVVLVTGTYADPLLLTDFSASVPIDALVTGIELQVEHASLSTDASDDLIELLQNGQPIGTNHATTVPWPMSPTTETYGGAYDTWGTSWNASDVRSPGFGVSIAAKYVGPPTGNERAYITSAVLIIYYTTPCD